VPHNPQVIDSPFDESPEVVKKTRNTRSNLAFLGPISSTLTPFGATLCDTSTRAREVSRRLLAWEMNMAQRRRRRLETRIAEIDNGADHLP
jgi:hypothetical protein